MLYILYTILILLMIGTIAYLLFSTREMIRVLIPIMGWGGFYVPTSHESTDLMVKLVEIKPTDIVGDFGSGDGRLLIAAAKAGAQKGVGYEIQHWLVKLSKKLIAEEKLEDKIQILPNSFWHADVSNTTVILLYQISYAMKGIEEKLQKELPVGARVAANGFVFPNWKEEKIVGNVRLYIKR